MSQQPTFNILVADDELSLRSIVSEVLTDAGYNVDQATNGREALEKVQAGNVHVVVTDIRMPEMTGIELLEKVKEFDENIQVVIMTSYASIETAIKAIRLGAYDYLTKPFEDLDIIPAVINRTVEKMRLQWEIKNLVAALQKRNEEIQALYENTKELFNTLKFDEVLVLSIKAVFQMSSAKNVTYFNYNAAEKALVPRSWLLEKTFDPENPPSLPMPEGDSVEFFQKIDDLTELKEEIKKALNAESLHLFPTFITQNFIGVFAVEPDPEREPFDEDMLGLLNQYIQNVSVQSEKATLHQRVRQLAVKDGLTNLYNHRYFQSSVDAEIERYKRFSKSFSIILFDIDHFKHYNDTNGHQMGDQLLQQIGQIMIKTGRTVDVAARYGGEEFVLLLAETEKDGAAIRAEKLRQAIEEFPFNNQDKQPLGNLTVSGGFAEYPTDGGTKEELIEAADQALYAAKRGGRNCLLAAEKAPKE